MQPIALSPLTLDPANGVGREPPRPPHARQADYEQAFDAFTLFYDCFRAADPRWIVFMGPPLANLDRLALSVLRTPGTSLIVRDLDRHSQIWVSLSESHVELPNGAFEQTRIAIQPNCCDLFRGKRVVFTKSKDNDLQWIRDWATYHARKHGSNAVLLYDNASRRYASDEIREMLARIPGLDVAVVVDWPYKFGPQGIDEYWDSDFCEYGILEHGRLRFLALAEGVINADVDEFVFTEDGASVYDRMRASPAGFVLYPGVWIESVGGGSSGAGRRHADFRYRLKGNPDAALKWTVAPPRCPALTQWRTHHITGMTADRESSRGISYWHFRAINTNWKELRWRRDQPGPDHVLDRELVGAMKMFGGNDLA